MTTMVTRALVVNKHGSHKRAWFTTSGLLLRVFTRVLVYIEKLEEWSEKKNASVNLVPVAALIIAGVVLATAVSAGLIPGRRRVSWGLGGPQESQSGYSRAAELILRSNVSEGSTIRERRKASYKDMSHRTCLPRFGEVPLRARMQVALIDS